MAPCGYCSWISGVKGFYYDGVDEESRAGTIQPVMEPFSPLVPVMMEPLQAISPVPTVRDRWMRPGIIVWKDMKSGNDHNLQQIGCLC